MAGKKILIVDDSASVRAQVAAALKPAGFEVVEAVDGVDGAARMAKTPDLSAVICDVNMPRMNGLEMLEKVSPGGKSPVPILMLTTEAQPALIARAKLAGAKGWIVKPFKPDLLVVTMRRLCGV